MAGAGASGLADNGCMPLPEDPGRSPAPGEHPPVPPAELPLLLRWLLLAFAVSCVVLGVIGILVPGMPTTVFIILAAWAAARSSPRFHAWLMRNRIFGPMLVNWYRDRSVSRRAKWSATAAMAVCGLIVGWFAHPRWVAGLAICCMACVLFWLWRRPEPLG